MPTKAKSTSNISKLGDLANFNVSSSAVPFDTADSSGSVPTFNTSFVNGDETEFLIGESLTLSSPSIGTVAGEIVSHSKNPNSAVYQLDSNTILARLNSELRVYPLSDYLGVEDAYIPLYAIDYWTQQCGIFYSAVPGDVLYYQSFYGQLGAYAKNITRPVRSTIPGAAGGAVQGTTIFMEGRVMMNYGRNYESVVNLPKPLKGASNYLPVLIPKGDGKKAVFGVDQMLAGIGNQSLTTWYMKTSDGREAAIRLRGDVSSGFTLYTSDAPGVFDSRAYLPASSNTNYTVAIGVSNPTTTTAKFTMSLFNPDGTAAGTVDWTGTSIIQSSMQLTTIINRGEDMGSGSPNRYSNSFISEMPAMLTVKPAQQKKYLPGLKKIDFLVGFSGNVWEHLKQYCSIFHLDVGYEDGMFVVKPRQRNTKTGVVLTDMGTQIQARDQARNVEVVVQNHTPTGNSPKLLFKADTVYQIAVGEVQEILVQTEHSILETRNPVAVSGINPFPYTSGGGQYVVTGSDGYIVSPSFWNAQGGLITTETTENEGEIKITIKGPDFDSPRAPYRISEGDAGRPALYVTGLGVLTKPKTLKVSTGNSKAAKDVGVTLDSPFISNAKLAFDAAARAARAFSVPDFKVTVGEPLEYDSPSSLGIYPAGSLIRFNGNILRIVEASQSYSKLSGTAVQHNTISQYNRSFAGTAPCTIAQLKAYYNGKTIGQVNLRPNKKAGI